jgi:hypothetical protein
VATGKVSQVGNINPTQHLNMAGGSKVVLEQGGKRKVQGGIFYGDREGGKHNKPTMEVENMRSSELVEAVEQPHQSK